jgi:hypothetical protein
MDAMVRTQDFLATSYDASWIAEGTDQLPADRALLVDVGGGAGQTLQAILSQTPGLAPERCVLQDRPEVIERSGRTEDLQLRRVQMMGMDFHQGQPVKGRFIISALFSGLGSCD